MNFRHLAAIVGMRWQILRNQFGRSGQANRIVTFILLLLASLASFASFVFAVGWGKLLLAKIEPFYLMYVWDGLIGGFLFAWAIALLVELQRSEMLSLRNLLHLPISLSSGFMLNYASSLASLTLLLFLPSMLGLCVASALQFGALSLLSVPLLLSFVFMVTAISYQLRGWLARLMENKRTRGTVITLTTIFFVLIFQIPNMINLGTMRSRNEARREQEGALFERVEELQKRKAAGEIDDTQYTQSVQTVEDEIAEQRGSSRKAKLEFIHRTATQLNMAIPIGWLAYGASVAADGEILSPLLCLLGMFTIGAVSLVLAYRSTIRAYTGAHNREYRPGTRHRGNVRVQGSLLDWKVPLLSDTQSVLVMTTFSTTLRAPEAKMALLTPLIFACIFGAMILTGGWGDLPAFTRPWLVIGALGISLVGMLQMLLNMFGLDRQGFRAYVLMPATRRDILLGKNLGILPIAGTLSGLLVLFIGVVSGLPFSHVVAALLQVIIAYLMYFPISNYTSIVAPVGMAVGTMKPVSIKFSYVLIQLVALLLSPLAVLPAAVALSAEQLLGMFAGTQGVPVYLLLTIVELPFAIGFYLYLLNLQGTLLQQREQAILDVISKVAE